MTLYQGDFTVLKQNFPHTCNLCLMARDEFFDTFDCFPEDFRTVHFKFIDFYDDDEIDRDDFWKVIKEAI